MTPSLSRAAATGCLGPELRGDRIGVLDIGSNTARLVVFEPRGDGFVAVASARSALKLVRDVDSGNGQLSFGAYVRTCDELRRFREVADAAGAQQVVAVATAAVRDASNGREFVAALKADTGFEIAIIDGDTEATEAARGALLDMPEMDGYLLDGGGGSLEIVEVRGGVPQRRWSTRLGALRLADAWLHGDPPVAGEVLALVAHVRTTVEKLDLPPLASGGTLLASGGTVRNLLRRSNRVADDACRRSITATELGAIRADLVSKTAARRALTAGLNPDRADSIVAGVVVVDTLLTLLGASEMVVSRYGLREGLMASALSRSTPERRPAALHVA